MLRARLPLSMLVVLFFGCQSEHDDVSLADLDEGPKADDVDGTARAALQAVDLSFLVPPPAKGLALGPEIHIAETGAHGPLLSRDAFSVMFAALDGFADARTNFGDEDHTFARFFVTGVRYDPCAPQAFTHGTPSPNPVSESACEAELRLVVQPWIPTEPECEACGDGFEDAAFHLIYRIPEDATAAVVEDLAAMRDACDGQRGAGTTAAALVGPHPCLVDLGSTDAAARDRAKAFVNDHLRPLLLEHAGMARLAGTAAMLGVHDGAENEWEWRLFVHRPQGLVQVPQLPHNVAGEHPDKLVFHEEGTYFFDIPTATIRTAGGRTIPVARIEDLTSGMRFEEERFLSGELFDEPNVRDGLLVAYTAANPRLSRLPTPAGQGGIDCITCHVQGAITTIVEERGILQAIAARDPAFFATLQATAFGSLSEPGRDHLPATRRLFDGMVERGTEQFVINFGYFHDQPSINPRTVHEAIDAAAYLQHLDETSSEPGETSSEPDETSSEPGETSSEPGGGLLFSEYHHGSGGARALEIHNRGSQTDLAGCQVLVYQNGSATASVTVPLDGALAAGATLALCENVSGPACISPPASMRFNGDDAIELRCDGDVVDALAVPGERSSWGDRKTLQRNCDVQQGIGVTRGNFEGDRAAFLQEWTAGALTLGSTDCS